MKLPAYARAWPLLLALATAVTLPAALVVGGIAFTKRLETRLLAEPNPLAAVSAKVGYDRQLTVEEARGAWLRVREGASAGWVFSGNVSVTRPVAGTGTAGLGLSASETTATAATRGLMSEAATAYATRRNLPAARDDLAWLLEQGGAITEAEVEKFLQEQKRGEYQ